MAERLQMQISETGEIDATGIAIVEVGPTSYKEAWETSIVGVQSSAVTDIPICQIFLGNVFVGGTFTGDMDSDTSMNLTVQSGQSIRAVWSGGDIGASVTLTVTGVKVIG